MKQTLRKTLALKALMLVTMLVGAINKEYGSYNKTAKSTSLVPASALVNGAPESRS